MAKAPEILKIDPNGDTLFILRNADAPFATDSSFELWPRALPQYWTLVQQQNEYNLRNCALVAEVARDETAEIQMQLSSEHLALASTYFQRMMANDWKESKAENGYAYTITADDWNADALITMMNIIHGQTQKVPKSVDVEKLAKIAVLVDYYQCHEAIRRFAKVWISLIAKPLYLSYSRDTLLRLFISYVFSDNNAFTKLTDIIIFESRGTIHTLGLPIPKGLVDALESMRQQRISEFISRLNSLKLYLVEEESECSFECLSMSLGALIKGMRAMHLYDPQPTKPFNGYSITALAKALFEIRTPKYNPLLYHKPQYRFSGTTTAVATSSTNTNTVRAYHFGTGSGADALPTWVLDCSIEQKVQDLFQDLRTEIQNLQLESFS